MAQCKACNAQVNDGEKTCPSCGAQLYTSSPNTDFGQTIVNMTKTPDMSAEFDANDIEQNKVGALFSYLSILVLIPLLAFKESKFARFHANQGILLLILEAGIGIVFFILGIITGFIPVVGGIIGVFFGALHSLLQLVMLALSILGIVNVANGKAKQLPIIGGITLIK